MEFLGAGGRWIRGGLFALPIALAETRKADEPAG
jgi:hypothetical protein